MVISGTGSVEGIMPLYIAQSGDLEGCHACLTDSLTLKDSATQLFIKYKSGALVTQKVTLFRHFTSPSSLIACRSHSLACVTKSSSQIGG